MNKASAVLDVASLAPTEQSLVSGAEIDPNVLDGITTPPVEIGHGFNSRAYQVGEYVLKVGKQSLPYERARQLAETMQDEHNLNNKYLGKRHGNHLPPTTLWVASLDGNPAVSHFVALQPFQKGRAYREHVLDPDTDNGPTIDFMQKCLAMFRATHKIPNLANFEGAFKVIKTNNVIVADGDKPVLVNTTYGKLQRSKLTGWAISGLINSGVKEEIDRLRHPF